MRELLNTLYVQTPGTWLGLDHDSVLARIDDDPPRRVPLRRLEGIVVFGRVSVSTPLIQRCGQNGITLAWHTASGRFTGSLRSPTSGNVLLRRAQHEAYDDKERRLNLARTIVAGKLVNSARFARHAARLSDPNDTDQFRSSATAMDAARISLSDARDLDTVRGVEGQASRLHFDDFRRALKADLGFDTRSRRPPLSPVNALLSFVYGLGRTRVEHALDGAGLDPQVGYLHSLRPGRPALALDLLEEHRPVCDRFVLTLLNRRQIDRRCFDVQGGGAVLLNEDGRRKLLEAWSALLEREVTHRTLKESVPYGLVPPIQAVILARALRGDLPTYLPFMVEPD
jgi:CRISPR-associated protein Cas1